LHINIHNTKSLLHKSRLIKRRLQLYCIHFLSFIYLFIYLFLV